MHRKILKSQRGDTFVSVLIAGAIMAGAGVAGGAIVKLLRKEATLSSAAGTAIAIESQIMLSLQNPETFSSAGVADSLRSGSADAAAGLTIKLKVDDNPAHDRTVAVAGNDRAVSLDGAGNPCVAAAGKPCAMQTRLRLNCSDGVCRAAYRIEFDPAANGGTAIPTIGASAWPPVADDYTTVISYDLYRRNDLQNVCRPNELFVTALDRKTGAVTCVSPPPDGRKLSSNEVAASFRWTPGNVLDFERRTLRRASCPAKYVLQNVNPRELENRSSNSTCVYRYQAYITWAELEPWPTGMEHVSGPMCPPEDYVVEPSGPCQGSVVPGSEIRGYCAKVCQDGAGNFFDCSYETNPNTAGSVTQSVSGNAVSCTYNYPPQPTCEDGRPSGASYRGQVSWSGGCRLRADLPIQRPAEE